jgi:hypothetical protein
MDFSEFVEMKVKMDVYHKLILYYIPKYIHFSRERNREHAKRTRMRKKNQFEGMKTQLLKLQDEGSKLEQILKESNAANILLCMGLKKNPEYLDKAVDMEKVGPYSGTSSVVSSDELTDGGLSAEIRPSFDLIQGSNTSGGNLVDQLRLKVRAEAANAANSAKESLTVPSSSRKSCRRNQSFETIDDIIADGSDRELNMNMNMNMNMNINSKYSETNYKSSINWRNRTIVGTDGKVRQLTNNELDDIKRERNRMHAKLTRNRKKMFMSKIKQTIDSLEAQNSEMREKLNRVARVGLKITSSEFSNAVPQTVNCSKNIDLLGLGLDTSHMSDMGATPLMTTGEVVLNDIKHEDTSQDPVNMIKIDRRKRELISSNNEKHIESLSLTDVSSVCSTRERSEYSKRKRTRHNYGENDAYPLSEQIPHNPIRA